MKRTITGSFIALLLVSVLAACAPPLGGGTGNGGKGPSPVLLGKAGTFVILAKSGVSNVPTSAVTGDIGLSPNGHTALTGFSETLAGSGVYSTAAEVTGKLYASDYAVPTPSNLITAINNMETAYNDAAGRPANVTGLGAGDISGRTLAPGVYKWSTGVSINTDVTLSGGANDTWVFQIAGDLTVASAKSVILAGGAQAGNIVWQTFGVAKIGTTAHVEGTILAKTSITLDTGASVHGRLLAQTAVTLDGSTVTQP